MKRFAYPRLDETAYRGTLSNGLDVIVVPRKGFSKKLAYFVTDFGSIHTHFSFEGKEYNVPAGIAHFLEHKLFDMPDERDVMGEFASLGAMVNAMTSYDMTAYYFSCTENFNHCLRLLLEFVSTPYFTEETVRKELGIIDQEIGMYDDSPDSRVYENLMRIAYENHPIRVPILGTSESIRQITPELLHLCHRAFYTPGNMLLFVIGDVEPEEVEAIAGEVLGKESREVAVKHSQWDEPMECRKPYIEQNMEVAMPMFNLLFKSRPTEKGEKGIRREMVADLAAEALFGESSPLYLKLYEQGIIDSSFGGGFETIDGCAMLMASGDSDDPDAVWEAIAAQAERLAQTGVSEEEFQRMKRSTLGRRIRGLDSFDSTCFRLCAYHMTGYDYLRFPEIHDRVASGEILEFLKEVVREDNCALSVIYPNCQEDEK